jgi:hypothetical protein
MLCLGASHTLRADSWLRLFDLGPNESIVQFAGSGGVSFILGSNYQDPQTFQIFVIKIDQSTGNILWKYTYSYAESITPRSIYATTGGGCVIAADFADTQTPPYPIVALVLKIDGSGNLEWKRTYQSSNSAFSHIEPIEISCLHSVENCKQHVMAHEIGHQFNINVCSGVPNGHCNQLAWCANDQLKQYCGNMTNISCVMNSLLLADREDGIERFDINDAFLATCPYQGDSVRKAKDPQ